MKKHVLLFLCLCLFFATHSKALPASESGTSVATTTINVPTAGTLNTLIASGDKASITNLTLTGTIDARDVKFLRDELVNLAVLDISGVSISSYSGVDGTVSSNTTYPANEMPVSSFKTAEEKDILKTITLPNSITSIGGWAFENCRGLTSIVIPNAVTTLGFASFSGCTKLTSVSLPASLTTIGMGSFGDEWAVKEYIVDPNNQHFSSADGVLFDKAKTTLLLFPKGSNNTTYTIPSTVTTIGEKAFQSCFGLTQISIPASLTTIVTGAFGNSRGLTEFVVSPNNMIFSALDGVLFNKNQTTLMICPAGKKGNYTIPNTVNTIQGSAFSGCTSLTSIVIGNSVSDIGTGSFIDCWKLESISTTNTTPLSLTAPYVFGYMNNTKWTLYVPAGSIASYLTANQWKDLPKVVQGMPAMVETDNASSITATTVVAGGNVLSEGTSAVTERGICWGFDALPTIADSKTAVGAGAGTFTGSISSLLPGQMYHVRAYATTGLSTAYGSDVTFVTVGTPPTVSTTQAIYISSTSAIVGGDVTSIGTSSTMASGVCWSTSANPTINDNKTTDGVGYGMFRSSIVGLSPGVTYHYRAYATNYSGTSYGEDLTFVTTTTGLSDGQTNSIVLYPNPAIDKLHIKDIDGVANFTLTDLSGRLLINKMVTSNEPISVSDLPKGIYIVKITTKNRAVEKKVLKY